MVQGDVYDDIIDLIQEKWPQARFCMRAGIWLCYSLDQG